MVSCVSKKIQVSYSVHRSRIAFSQVDFFAFLCGRIVLGNRRSARDVLSTFCFHLFYSVAGGAISCRTIVRMLWQKIALPTPPQKFLKPLKWHRDSRNARFKHEIVPSILPVTNIPRPAKAIFLWELFVLLPEMTFVLHRREQHI